jgi:spore protease
MIINNEGLIFSTTPTIVLIVSIELMEEKLSNKTDDVGKIMGILSDLEYNEKHAFIKEILSPMYGESIVTPSYVDEIIDSLSSLLAESINRAVHPGYVNS